jgi:hypothetical protein
MGRQQEFFYSEIVDAVGERGFSNRTNNLHQLTLPTNFLFFSLIDHHSMTEQKIGGINR